MKTVSRTKKKLSDTVRDLVQLAGLETITGFSIQPGNNAERGMERNNHQYFVVAFAISLMHQIQAN